MRAQAKADAAEEAELERIRRRNARKLSRGKTGGRKRGVSRLLHQLNGNFDRKRPSAAA